MAAATIRDAVQSQLISDVPVGLELSGGIDSSLVAWAASGTGLNGYSAIPDAESLSEEEQIDHVGDVTQTKTNKLLITRNRH